MFFIKSHRSKKKNPWKRQTSFLALFIIFKSSTVEGEVLTQLKTFWPHTSQQRQEGDILTVKSLFLNIGFSIIEYID